MRRIGGFAAALLFLFGLLVIQNAGAFASHVTCGETITQDTKLDSDLLNCPGDGVIIGADNITLDLNGHTIEGGGFYTHVGVRNEDHSGVTAEDGTVRNFEIGVRVESASDNVVRDLRLSNVGTGVLFVAVTDSTIAKNFAPPGTLHGVALVRSDRNQVERNEFVGAGLTAPFGFIAIDVTGGSDNLVEQNSVTKYGIGIQLLATQGALVERNAVIETVMDGISVTSQSSDVRLERNRVQLAGNVIGPGAADGIFVAANSTGAVLEQNSTDANTDDGIDVDDPTATLARNRADDNFDLGIEGVPGVTDGGGNRASGNGNPLQCTGVVCK